MIEPQTITKVASEVSSGHFTFIHMIYAMIVAGLSGGFFNPAWKYIYGKLKKPIEDASEHPAVKIAEIKKDEKTEDKLWERIEILEIKLQTEVDKRIASEKVQADLQNQINELKRERLFTLSRYIHLKLRIEEAKREIEYLKSKLREKDPEFDKDYPNFSAESDSLANEKLVVSESMLDKTLLREILETSSAESHS